MGASNAVLRVLVVDDAAGINGLLEARMLARGYEVVTASNGVEAMQRVRAAPPDFMLLDVSMPEMGGLEVLDEIRAARLDIAVVMTTAFGSEQVAILPHTRTQATVPPARCSTPSSSTILTTCPSVAAAWPSHAPPSTSCTTAAPPAAATTAA